MSTLITTDEIREHVESGLGDSALERIVDGCDAEIIRYAGPHFDATQNLTRSIKLRYGDKNAWLPSKASSIVSVNEQAVGKLSDDSVSVDATEYELANNGWSAHKPNGWRASTVIVEYVPVNNNSQRVLALIDLVQLQTKFTGIQSESVNGYRSTQVNYEKEHGRILKRLVQSQRLGPI